jgi:hypothetical protein
LSWCFQNPSKSNSEIFSSSLFLFSFEPNPADSLYLFRPKSQVRPLALSQTNLVSPVLYLLDHQPAQLASSAFGSANPYPPSFLSTDGVAPPVTSVIHPRPTHSRVVRPLRELPQPSSCLAPVHLPTSLHLSWLLVPEPLVCHTRSPRGRTLPRAQNSTWT